MENETLLKYFPNSKKAKALTKGKTFVAKEGSEQIRLIQWLNIQYPPPSLIWSFDLAGVNESIVRQASDYRPYGFKMPDFQLMHPRGGYNGLFIELKRTDFKLYTKSGTMKKNEHIEVQAKSLYRLRDLGYWADFASGFDDAKSKIQAYLNGAVEELENKSILKLGF